MEGTYGGCSGTNSSREEAGALVGVPIVGTQGRAAISLQSGWQTNRQSSREMNKINI